MDIDLAFLHALIEATGIFGAFSIAALIYVWREWRKEAAAKDALYEKYIYRITGVVADYHRFAHALERHISAGEDGERRAAEVR